MCGKSSFRLESGMAEGMGSRTAAPGWKIVHKMSLNTDQHRVKYPTLISEKAETTSLSRGTISLLPLSFWG